jgi:hypothetical protein
MVVLVLVPRRPEPEDLFDHVEFFLGPLIIGAAGALQRPHVAANDVSLSLLDGCDPKDVVHSNPVLSPR